MNLWDVTHRYYCSQTNYYVGGNGNQLEYKSFDDFLEEWGDSDMDYDLLFRWDWIFPEDRSSDPCYRDGELYLFWMGQRKGVFKSSLVHVCEADQDRVKKFLAPRFDHLMGLWRPFATTTGEKQCAG